MKNIILITCICLMTSIVYSQKIIPYYKWSSASSFKASPQPLVVGYGALSDSLSNVYNGITFYEYNGEYYPITSWADYYFWYVNKFWYEFDEPLLYKFYYYAGDDYGMAQFICGRNFKGRFYPSLIALSFPGKDIEINRISRHAVKRYVRQYEQEDSEYASISKNHIQLDKNKFANQEIAKNDKKPKIQNSLKGTVFINKSLQRTNKKGVTKNNIDRSTSLKNSKLNSNSISLNRGETNNVKITSSERINTVKSKETKPKRTTSVVSSMK